jgi:hypothetical protein
MIIEADDWKFPERANPEGEEFKLQLHAVSYIVT